jgi:hypothetical protein
MMVRFPGIVYCSQYHFSRCDFHYLLSGNGLTHAGQISAIALAHVRRSWHPSAMATHSSRSRTGDISGLCSSRQREADQRLLATRLRDLPFTMADSFFVPHLAALDRELRRAGLRLQPNFYLCTSYGCVVRTSNIGILFTDGFPATRRLARSIGLRVRNGTDILRTLRHEAGHAFCYVNRLHETPRFRELFDVTGDFYDTYPDCWRPSHAALKRVRRGEIIGMYAHRHADEDFAVCFQTWLADPAGCTHHYHRRPVILEKLAYVAETTRRLGSKIVPNDPADLDEPIGAISLTLQGWLDHVRKIGDYNLFPKGPVA